MRKQDIKIGESYDWGGYIVEVIDILSDGVAIECPEIGQDVVQPRSLQPLQSRTEEPVFYDY
jgi:hypothetical protein